MRQKVTMQQIADNLNLSKSIVSRALSDKYGVNEKTKALVLHEAARLNYQLPDNSGKKKAPGKVISVFMLRHTLTGDINFGAKIVNGIERAISKRYMQMNLILVDDCNESELVTRAENSIGIIVCTGVEGKFLTQLKQLNIPIVTIDPRHLGSRLNCILADNYFGMFDATSYLIERGHRKLMFVGDPSYSYAFLQRYHGFSDCVQKYAAHGVEARYVLEKSSYLIPHLASGYRNEEFVKVLDGGYTPTAIACANDPTAEQIYVVLKARGFKIPDDISVIGFDNTATTEFLDPPLTTLNISKHQLGESAVSMLVDNNLIKSTPYCIQLLGVNIVERNSVKTISESKNL